MTSHQFRGKPARRQRKRGGFSQASTRRGITLYDQHGREWTAQVGLKSGRPTGQIEPNFIAPWYPDQQYLRVNPENTSELFIDYMAMLARRRARRDQYHKAAVDFAREKKLEEPTLGQYPEAIRRSIGGSPKAIEPVVAAIQGNRYILGLTTVVDRRLERFVTVQRTDAIVEEFDFHDDESGDARSFASARAAAAKVRERVRDLPAEPTPEAEEDLNDLELLDGGTTEDTVDELLDGLATEDLEDDDDEDLDETFDPEATGGKTVAPGNEERVARQAPRRPQSSAKRARHGANRGGGTDAQKTVQRAGRKTLADGAAPVIADGGL